MMKHWKALIKLFPQISKEREKLELVSFALNFDVLMLFLNDGENIDSSCNNCKI